MCIKMQHGVFDISNNEEYVIHPANLLSLWSTALSNRRVDHKDRILAGLITFSSLLLITLYFDPHLKLINTSALHQKKIFRLKCDFIASILGVDNKTL